LTKRKLFVFPSFYPAYKSGGPVRSATNLIRLLKDKYIFDVFTADRDLGEESPFNNVEIDSWNNKYEKANVFYSSSSKHSFRKLLSVFKGRKYNTIYINSFFNYRYAIQFVILYKLGFLKTESFILAPRGELTNGAMSIKKLKKKVYLYFFRFFGLKNNITFHFTSPQEKEESLNFIGKSKSLLVPNMHGDLPDYIYKEKAVGELNLTFLSRISPKKNLLIALEALSKVKIGSVIFTVAGQVDDDAYWEKCKAKINNLPSNIKVNFIGAINRKQVAEELFKSHMFILPTLNENYGHAIVEAMMHSNLVLISENTPWTDVQSNGGCVVYHQCIDQYAEEINKALLLDGSEFNRQSQSVYQYCNAILQSNVASINKMFE
tara:strand:- start:1282 stop:2412 length:1131 start_codon:yes stop_codon:yes gene_type:complete